MSKLCPIKVFNKFFYTYIKKELYETSLVVHWLWLWASTTVGTGSTFDLGTQIPHAAGVSSSVVPDSLRPHSLQPTRLLSPWDFPGKDTGVVCHFLLQHTAWCSQKKFFIKERWIQYFIYIPFFLFSFFQWPTSLTEWEIALLRYWKANGCLMIVMMRLLGLKGKVLNFYLHYRSDTKSITEILKTKWKTGNCQRFHHSLSTMT